MFSRILERLIMLSDILKSVNNEFLLRKILPPGVELGSLAFCARVSNY